MKVALAVTAAGRSLRFGSDKLSYPCEGLTVAEASLRVYEGIPFCDKVIVLNPASGAWTSAILKSEFRTVMNPAPENGLSSSVKLAVSAILEKGGPDGILFATADMPFIRQASVLKLLELFEKEPGCICALSADGVRGKPVIFPKHLFPCFFALEGDSGGRSVIEKNRALLRTLRVEGKELTDIDTPEEAKLFL